MVLGITIVMDLALVSQLPVRSPIADALAAAHGKSNDRDLFVRVTIRAREVPSKLCLTL